MEPRRALAVVAGVALTAAFAASLVTTGCEDAQSYVYSAQKYDPAGDCLGAYAPVETVNGAGESSTCAPLCLAVGEVVYVSTMCPPLPAIATPGEPDAGACIAALAAQKRGGTCDTPADASDEAAEDSPSEAGEEAGPEAGEDAADAASDATPKDASDAG